MVTVLSASLPLRRARVDGVGKALVREDLFLELRRDLDSRALQLRALGPSKAPVLQSGLAESRRLSTRRSATDTISHGPYEAISAIRVERRGRGPRSSVLPRRDDQQGEMDAL